MTCEVCGHWTRCPACQGWACEVCGADLGHDVKPVQAGGEWQAGMRHDRCARLPAPYEYGREVEVWQ